MDQGIYIIKNKINGKVYVGQSIALRRRKADHFKALRNDRHSNQYLQNAFNKYGEREFEFIVIERWDASFNTNKEYKDGREIFYIDFFNANNPEFGYNLSFPSEDKKTLVSPISHKTRKNVFVYNRRNLEFIQEYESVAACAKDLNINEKRITDNLTGRKKYYQDWIFQYTKCQPVYEKRPGGSKKITIDGITYKSKKEAAEKTGISYDKLCRKEDKRYASKSKTYKYILTTPTGEEIKLYYAKDALKHIPLATTKGIQKLIAGTRKSYFNYTLTKIQFT